MRNRQQVGKESPIPIATARNGKSLTAEESGDITVKTFEDGDNLCRTMSDVLFVKDLKCNLMSIGRLCDKGFEVTFSKHEATIKKDGKVEFKGYRNGSLYELRTTKSTSRSRRTYSPELRVSHN